MHFEQDYPSLYTHLFSIVHHENSKMPSYFMLAILSIMIVGLLYFAGERQMSFNRLRAASEHRDVSTCRPAYLASTYGKQSENQALRLDLARSRRRLLERACPDCDKRDTFIRQLRTAARISEQEIQRLTTEIRRLERSSANSTCANLALQAMLRKAKAAAEQRAAQLAKAIEAKNAKACSFE